MPTGVGRSGKAQMAVLGQNLQISEHMLNAFAALVRKHQVPGAQFAIYRGNLTISAKCSGCVRMPRCGQFVLCSEF
jgi:hypothetical protein